MACIIGEEAITPAQATVTTSEPVDHEGRTSIKVTIEGEQSGYEIRLTGPDGTEIDYEYVLESQMADGIEAVWISMTGYRDYVSADPGKYSLLVTDWRGNLVYQENFVVSGADLKAREAIFLTCEEEYSFLWKCTVIIPVSNNGDLPDM